MTPEEQRKRNREQMPNVAAMLDEFRAANPGLQFKVVWAKDHGTGLEVGKRDDPKPEQVFVIPESYGQTKKPEASPSWKQIGKKGKRK
jgi:hypothetical protein